MYMLFPTKKGCCEHVFSVSCTWPICLPRGFRCVVRSESSIFARLLNISTDARGFQLNQLSRGIPPTFVDYKFTNYNKRLCGDM